MCVIFRFSRPKGVSAPSMMHVCCLYLPSHKIYNSQALLDLPPWPSWPTGEFWPLCGFWSSLGSLGSRLSFRSCSSSPSDSWSPKANNSRVSIKITSRTCPFVVQRFRSGMGAGGGGEGKRKKHTLGGRPSIDPTTATATSLPFLRPPSNPLISVPPALLPSITYQSIELVRV